jgi:hypothetical protein
MDRRERRRRARETKKIEQKLRKAALQPRLDHQESPTRLRQALQSLRRVVTRTYVLFTLVVALVGIASGYALFHPRVSVEPGLVLNSVDPFSTAFTIKNENSVFPVYDIKSICWTQGVNTSNNIRVWGPGPPERTRFTIPVLEPMASSTIGCPSVIGGLGSHTGAVLQAQIEINVSYRQTGWPYAQTNRYPFKSIRDSQGEVHWIHISPAEEQSMAPPQIR